MKIKKNTLYESLYISDIHYLIDQKIKNHCHKELFKALDYFKKKKIKFKKIILVGDIIEDWYFDASRKVKKSRKRFDRLFDRLDKMAIKNGKKIYLIGNHDSTRYNFKLPERIESYLDEHGWQIGEQYEDEYVICAHGHQGEMGRAGWLFSIIMVRVLYRIAGLLPGIWHVLENFWEKHFDFDKEMPVDKVLDYYAKLSKKLRNDSRVLITGHTHKATILPEVGVINTGDWVVSKTLVIQKKNSFGLFQYHNKTNRKFIELAFYKHPVASD